MGAISAVLTEIAGWEMPTGVFFSCISNLRSLPGKAHTPICTNRREARRCRVRIADFSYWRSLRNRLEIAKKST